MQALVGLVVDVGREHVDVGKGAALRAKGNGCSACPIIEQMYVFYCLFGVEVNDTSSRKILNKARIQMEVKDHAFKLLYPARDLG